MHRTRRRPPLLLLAALLALSLLADACSEDAAAAPSGSFVFRIPVTWAPLAQTDVVETVELVGDVYSRRWANLAFERAGRIIAVDADIGDEVTEGTELARLDDAVLEQQLQVARAQADAAVADQAFAEREAERATQAGDDVLSASEQDRRTSAAATARATTAQRQAEIARLSAMLAQGVLTAPFDGVIEARQVTLGSHATPGQTVFTLVDVVNREVHLEIPPDVATGLKVGAPVVLRVDELPDLRIETKLDELVPAADLSSRTFVGVVRLADADPNRRLMPGMFVRARFEKTRVHGKAVVPADAILNGDAGPYVVVMDEPKAGAAEDGGPPAPTARIVPVTVLARDDEHAAIAPLEPGALPADAHVVVTGADNAFPGAPLAPVAEGVEVGGGTGGPGDGAAGGAP